MLSDVRLDERHKDFESHSKEKVRPADLKRSFKFLKDRRFSRSSDTRVNQAGVLGGLICIVQEPNSDLQKMGSHAFLNLY